MLASKDLVSDVKLILWNTHNRTFRLLIIRWLYATMLD